MGTYRLVHDKRAARPAESFFGVLHAPTTISLQAVLALGALVIVLLALAAYRNMLKPGVQAASLSRRDSMLRGHPLQQQQRQALAWPTLYTRVFVTRAIPASSILRFSQYLRLRSIAST